MRQQLRRLSASALLVWATFGYPDAGLAKQFSWSEFQIPDESTEYAVKFAKLGAEGVLRIVRRGSTSQSSSFHLTPRSRLVVNPHDFVRLGLQSRVARLTGHDRVILWAKIYNARGEEVAARNTDGSPFSSSSWHDLQIHIRAPADAKSMAFGVINFGFDIVEMRNVGISINSGLSSSPKWEVVKPSKRQLEFLVQFVGAYGDARFFHPNPRMRTDDWHALLEAGIDDILRGHFERARNRLRRVLMFRTSPRAQEMFIRYRGFPSDTIPDESVSREFVVMSRRDYAALRRPREIQHRYGNAHISIPLVAPAGRGWMPHLDLPISRRSSAPYSKPAVRVAAVAEMIAILRNAVWSSNWQGTTEELALAFTTVAGGDEETFNRTLEQVAAILPDAHTFLRWPDTPDIAAPAISFCRDKSGAAYVDEVGESAEKIVSAGWELRAIDGRRLNDVLSAQLPNTTGGSQQHRWLKSVEAAMSGPYGAPVALTMCKTENCTTVSVPRVKALGEAPNPLPIGNHTDSARLIDLRRISLEQFRQRLTEAPSEGTLILDLRGRPSMAPSFLGELAAHKITSTPIYLPLFSLPQKADLSFMQTESWEVLPTATKLRDVAFLIDAHTISYGETVSEMVKREKVGRLIGRRTAGGNGNLTSAPIPGGLTLSWSGMDVRDENGASVTGTGLSPDIEIHCGDDDRDANGSRDIRLRALELVH